jgi:hypothetical protein
MALLDALTTQRPRLLTLFKWVAIIFLVPVLLLAIIPTIVTVIAQIWKIADVWLIAIPIALPVACFVLRAQQGVTRATWPPPFAAS